jgi:pSer/pThr/pTyr-binding forkhead associated (FHA) protein
MASLIISQPDGSEVALPLGEDSLRIGRGRENDLQINDESVSTFHAEIHVENGRHVLKDLGSTNGVRVNGERVPQAVLSDGDLLRFGNIRVSYQGAPAPAEPVPAPEPVAEPEPTPVPHEMPSPAPKSGSSLPSHIIPDGPVASGARLRGFGPKKAAKDPEKTLYVTIGVVTVLICLASLAMSFTMQ